ncbi:Probable glycosyltransferase At5g03795, partial [Linum perenne]
AISFREDESLHSLTPRAPIPIPPSICISGGSSPSRSMTTGKFQQQSILSLRGSLLTLAAITFLYLTYASLNSLHSSLSSAARTSPALISSALGKRIVRSETNTDAGAGEKEIGGKDAFTDDEITDLYHFPEIFKLNYAAMEENFKVYIYTDGDPKTFYQTPRKLTGKYASEGYFFQNIRESKFRTKDPDQAHLFFIPISCHKMRGKFFVTCHDVGVRATEGVPFLVKNAIRAVCSPSYDVGFIPHKDEKDVYNLKQILKDIPHEQFVELNRNVAKVQKHFQWNTPPIKYDAFHMVMYDLWLRRHAIRY